MLRHALQVGQLIDAYVAVCPVPRVVCVPRVFVPAGEGWRERAETVAGLVAVIAVAQLELEEDTDADE